MRNTPYPVTVDGWPDHVPGPWPEYGAEGPLQACTCVLGPCDLPPLNRHRPDGTHRERALCKVRHCQALKVLCNILALIANNSNMSIYKI